MADKKRPPDLSDLQSRIAAAREREQVATRPDPKKRAMASGYGIAIRLAIEMVAALGVSAPLFLIILLIMGMGAAFINVYKVASGFTHGSLRDLAEMKKDGKTRGD
jgi:F0F1-type ATP synthase assembly protein I